jgi:hypothetical protein
MKNRKIISLEEVLLQYSFEDLAKSFFVLNLWLPNVSSPIKSQYLYIILESIFDKLSPDKKIDDYDDFKEFVKKILPLIPSFHTLEDYIPENDWGEIQYYLNKKHFKILYGSDLSNPYDFMYSFEIIHLGFENFYRENLGRSPKQEFEFCLQLQNDIIIGITKESQEISDIEMGDFKIPTEIFWQDANEFINNYDPRTLFPKNLISEYTKDLDVVSPTNMPSINEFLTSAYNGTNCSYFFIKKGDSFFPVLPRRHFSILFDKWGALFETNHLKIEQKVEGHNLKIGYELFKFIRERTDEKRIFYLGRAIHLDLAPHKTLFSSFFISKNNLILIHILPLPISQGNIQESLNAIAAELKEAQGLIATAPMRIGLEGQGKMIQFDSAEKGGEILKPFIITIIPNLSTSNTIIFEYPSGLEGMALGIDQFVGICDEIEDLDELSDFLYYLRQPEISAINPLTSTLDLFGSFKDSHSVLIEGANNPDMLMLDFHWGTGFRYRSLSQFWKFFPEENSFGHPRSWSIANDVKLDEYIVLKSKKFIDYRYYFTFSTTSIFINSAIDLLSYEQWKITDGLMRNLVDAFKVYQDVIKGLPFTEDNQKIIVLFFPKSLVYENEQLKHLHHLIPNTEDLWLMDIARLKSREYGIRVIFNDEVVLAALRDAQDRSFQIVLFKSILEQLNTVFSDSGYADIARRLDHEKSQKNRFRIYHVEKKVSFPELSTHVNAERREFKLADKKIAEIGKAAGIVPNKYEGEEAKRNLDLLRTKLIDHLNELVSQFDFKSSIPILISNIDSLTNDHEQKEVQVENSMDQEVEYGREEFSGSNKQRFVHEHKNYRYVIEKFVQLEPKGERVLSDQDLAEILAIVDRILLLYSASDYLAYGLFPSKVNIGDDFLAKIVRGDDIDLRQKAVLEEQAKIRLGIIGNIDDDISLPSSVDEYIDQLDAAAIIDLGFSFKDLIDAHIVLSLWAVHHPASKENTFYSASLETITEVFVKKLTGIDPPSIKPMLNFMTLDPFRILVLEGKNTQESDLPVWEHRKRTMRYSIRPLIKVNDLFHWGSYSILRSGKLWAGILGNNKLPSDIKAPNLTKVLSKGHNASTESLQIKIKEIIARFTSYVKTDVYPHKQGFNNVDIGDIDVFALLKEKNILLNIESKIIDPAFCNKDLQRIARYIFGRNKSDGSFEEGYLHMVLKREAFLLEENGRKFAEKHWGALPAKPKVVSIFVTQTSYWWTKYPVLESNVHFVELLLLEDFIKHLAHN